MTSAVSAAASAAILPAPAPQLDPDYAASRQGRLGASDVATVLGLNPYQSPAGLWAEKTGRLPADEMSDATGPAAQGNLFEPVIAQLYANTTGATLYSGAVQLYGDWAACQLDRIAELPQQPGKPYIVEIKMRDRWSAEAQGWGGSGSTDVPKAVLVQVLMQQLLSGLDDTADVALYVDRDLRILRVPFDRELAEKISLRAHDWWTRHIKGDAEPTATKGADLHWLKRRIDQLTDEPLVVEDPDSELGQALWAFAEADAAYRTLKNQQKAAKARVAQLMGEHKRLKSTIGSVSYSAQKVGGGTDWKAVAAELAAQAGLSTEALEALARTHETGRLQRVFRWTAKKS